MTRSVRTPSVRRPVWSRVPLPVPVDHGAQRGGAGAEGGDAVVVLEPGELPDAGNRAGGGDLADRAAPAGGGGDVQDAEPGMVPAGAVPHGVAEDLQAGAHRQDPGAGVQGVMQVPVAAQPVGGEQLRGVLAAAEQVHIAPGGWGGVRGDGEDLGGDAAPAGPGGEHGGVAGVGVGAEHVREQQPDPDRRRAGHGGPAGDRRGGGAVGGRRCSWPPRRCSRAAAGPARRPGPVRCGGPGRRRTAAPPGPRPVPRWPRSPGRTAFRRARPTARRCPARRLRGR